MNIFKSITITALSFSSAQSIAASSMLPTSPGGLSIGGIMVNLSESAKSVGDAVPSFLYLIGSIALLYAGYIAYNYSRNRGRDQKHLSNAYLAILAAAFCFYMPTFLDIGVSSAMSGSVIQEIKLDKPISK